MSDDKFDPKTGRIDWSRFHPQLHPFMSRECFRWYGGPVRHAEYWYRYAFAYRLTDILHRVIGCAWGHHKLLDGAGIALYCKHCDYEEPVA